MTKSRIDLLIFDNGWRGTCARCIGMLLVCLGFKYLPDVIDSGSQHGVLASMSLKQTDKHGAILTLFEIAFGITVGIEVARWILEGMRSLTKSNRKKENGK
ncbi:hypothetical protein GCM10027093_23490 [Paraburkholderia jirisanensis]